MPTYSIIYKIDKKPLGIGGAARVYGCTRIADGERFAIKILSDKNDKGKVDRFKREIDAIVDIVNHGIDGVLPILDYDKDDLWYVMPLANSFSLFLEYIKTGKDARYTEDSDDRDIKEIIRETKMLLNNYKDAAKALSIKNI
ncbi:hypothetical protein [Prevotella sp.]|nr:hypothetical protein [Prevotella sp.]